MFLGENSWIRKKRNLRIPPDRYVPNQRAPNPQPNLHSSVWVGSNGGRPQRGGTHLGVFVPIWPVITKASSWPAIQEQMHPNLYPLAGGDCRLTLLKWGCADSGGFGARWPNSSPHEPKRRGWGVFSSFDLVMPSTSTDRDLQPEASRPAGTKSTVMMNFPSTISCSFNAMLLQRRSRQVLTFLSAVAQPHPPQKGPIRILPAKLFITPWGSPIPSLDLSFFCCAEKGPIHKKTGSWEHRFASLAAQKSHRKIAVTTVAASGLATIPRQILAGCFASPAEKNC